MELYYIQQQQKSEPWAILPNKIQNTIFCKKDIGQHGIVTFLSSIEILQTLLTRKKVIRKCTYILHFTHEQNQKKAPRGPVPPQFTYCMPSCQYNIVTQQQGAKPCDGSGTCPKIFGFADKEDTAKCLDLFSGYPKKTSNFWVYYQTNHQPFAVINYCCICILYVSSIC